MKDCIFSISSAELQGLFEVLDKSARPVCLLSGAEILRQHLPHRELAVILRDHSGKIVLRRENTGIFNFSAKGMIPAGLAAEEFLHTLLCDMGVDRGLVPRLLDVQPPETANNFAFTWIYAGYMAASRILAPEFMLLDRMEIAALICRDYPFDPFFRNFIEKYFSAKKSKNLP